LPKRRLCNALSPGATSRLRKWPTLGGDLSAITSELHSSCPRNWWGLFIPIIRVRVSPRSSAECKRASLSISAGRILSHGGGTATFLCPPTRAAV
jgi:hypothetical protein